MEVENKIAVVTGGGSGKALAARFLAEGAREVIVVDVNIEGIREERFLILTHEEVLEYTRRKTADYGPWIGGMNRLMKKLTGAV